MRERDRHVVITAMMRNGVVRMPVIVPDTWSEEEIVMAECRERGIIIGCDWRSEPITETTYRFLTE